MAFLWVKLDWTEGLLGSQDYILDFKFVGMRLIFHLVVNDL
jgi:hypothetical protein